MTVRPLPRIAPSLLTVLLSAALLVGCSQSPEEQLASAKSSLSEKDGQQAIIHLKGALQERPDWPEARYLLGQALLDGGDPFAAGVELRKALELKYRTELVVPPLARAMLQLRQYADIVNQFGDLRLAEPAPMLDLQASVAAAHLGSSQLAQGEALLQTVLTANPAHVPALMLKARLLAERQQADAAFAVLDKLQAAAPQDPEVWNLLADLLLNARKDTTGALAAYRKALAIKADFLPAHTSIVQLALESRDLDAASQQVTELKKLRPQLPQTHYLEAQVAYERGDLKTAGDLTRQLLGQAPEDVRLLQLAGAVALRSQAWRDAESHLQKALQAAPQRRQTRTLLAQAQLRGGQPAKALQTLAPLLNDGTDTTVLSTAADAYLAVGDPRKAEPLLVKLARLDPKSTRTRTSLAVARVSMGQAEAGMSELRKIASEGDEVVADLALIEVLTRRRNHAGVLAAIEALERKQPGKPLAPHLRGTIEVEGRQFDAARKSFERALSLDPTYFASIQQLASLDLAEKHPEQALARYQALLDKQPDHAQARLAVAALRARTGETPENVAQLLADAIKTHPADPTPRLRLIDLHLSTQNPAAAVSAAQDAVAAVPANVELWDALGRAMQRAGDPNQAQAAFAKIKQLNPRSPLPFLRLADLNMAASNPTAAMQNLNQALALQPNLLPAQRNLLALQLGAGKLADAAALAKRVQAQRPQDSAGFLFEGEVANAKQDFAAAANAFAKGLKLGPSTPLAIKLHMAQAQAGRAAEAQATADAWLQSNPKDAGFVIHLGRLAAGRQRLDEAERFFRRAVDMQPNDATGQQLLAWSLIKQDRPGALAPARKAAELAPNQSMVLSTLAMALAADKQMPEAVTMQKKAIELQPANHAHRLDLAKLYIRAGQSTEAKGELTALSQLGKRFPAQAEVTRLLATL